MQKKRLIAVFIIAVYLLSLALMLNKAVLANALAQATPALIAIVLIIFSKSRFDEIKQMGALKLGHLKWYLMAFSVPWAAIATGYFCSSWFGLMQFKWSINWLPFIYKFVLLSFMQPLLWAAGEELGWRGYLQPKLVALMGLHNGIFLTGIIWALWHLIFIFCGDYYEAGNLIIISSLQIIMVVLVAFTLGWIRWASQSVWPCVIFHSASNAAWQMWAYQLNVIKPNAIYFAGEAGIFNIIFWALCLLLIWRRLEVRDQS